MDWITSRQNQRVKDVARLFKPRERKETGLTVIEDERILNRALQQGAAVRELYVCPELKTEDECQRLEDTSKSYDVSVFAVTREVLQKISYRENPDGIVAIVTIPAWHWEDLEQRHEKLIFVGVGIEKPGNIGAILRSADGAGASGIILVNAGTDIGNPNIIRASTGTAFSVPLVSAEGSGTAFDRLRDMRLKLTAVSPAAEKLYTQADLASATALIFGPEDKGLPRASKEIADETVSIPMRGIADSLNISVSAALVLYEARRQREKSN